MKLAIHTNAFRDKGTKAAIETACEFSSSIGVELSTCREHLYAAIECWPDTIIQRKNLSKKVVAISGGWCDFVRGEGLDEGGYLDKQVWLAEELEVPLRLFLVNPQCEVCVTSANLLLASHRISDYFDTHPFVQVGFENHGGLTASPHLIHSILSVYKHVTGRTNIGVTVDPANYMRSGCNPFHAVRVLTPWMIKHVHAKGWLGNGTFTGVGQGLMKEHWKDIISHLKFIGYDGVISIEYEGEIDKRDDQIRRSIDFLRGLIDG